jgi:hypothetical protein
MAAMNMVSAGGFSGVSFHLRTCPQGVASVLCKKTPIFASRGSKLDYLTVFHEFSVVFGNWDSRIAQPIEIAIINFCRYSN